MPTIRHLLPLSKKAWFAAPLCRMAVRKMRTCITCYCRIWPLERHLSDECNRRKFLQYSIMFRCTARRRVSALDGRIANYLWPAAGRGGGGGGRGGGGES